MKKGLLLLMLLFALIVTFGCGNEEKEYSYVTVKINPEVEIVVADNVVVSINGLNDDGKLLIEGENFVGKHINEVCQEIVKLSEELGFIYSSEEKGEEYEIKITVNADNEKIKEQIEKDIDEKVKEVIEKLDIDAKINFLKEKEKEYFIKIAMEFDPTLTVNEASEMTNKELMQIINLATIEKAEFATVALEEYYYDLKEYEFQFKYKELLCNELDNSYSVLKQKYNELLVKLENEIIKLQDLKISLFTSEESDYVKALKKYNEKKKEVIALKVELENQENPNPLLEIKLSTELTALNILEATLETAKEGVELAFAVTIESLELILNNLKELEREFPETINFIEKFNEAEKYINDSKDKLFTKYESSVTKERIEKIKNDIKERKEELKKVVEESKNK